MHFITLLADRVDTAPGAGIFVGFLLFLGLVLYFIPTVIALSRRHYNLAAIIIINLFLGWSLIGWVIALAMSVSNPPPTPSQVVYVNDREKQS